MSSQAQARPPALPLISVVVPFFHDVEYIGICLESIQSQEGVDVEVLFVDDRGDDGSAGIVKDAMESDDRIRLIQHDGNRGLAASRNTGISYASGELLTFLDADDFLFPDSLRSRARRLVYKSHSEPEIGGCYCGWEMVPETAGLNYPPVGDAKNERLRYAKVAGNNPLIATAPLLWRRTLIDVGGFDESFETAEDFELWTRYLRQGYQLIPTGSMGVAYRQKSKGLIAEGLATHAECACRVLDYIDRPLSASEVSTRAPAPFRHSRAVHIRNSILLRRLTVFLVIAEGSGNQSESDALLRLVPNTMTLTDIATETGLDAALNAGLKRLELQHGPLEPNEASSLRTHVFELLVSAAQPSRESRGSAHSPLDLEACRARAVE